MVHHRNLTTWVIIAAAFLSAGHVAKGDEPKVEVDLPYPLTESEVAKLKAGFEETLRSNPTPPEASAGATNIHSIRGDSLFFLGRFKESVTEYQKMVTLDPSLDSSHWRLGIALFFADEPKLAVTQFEKYHSFDNVDRENGIWRYLSQFKATDSATAQKELIRYDRDDREPFPAVYKLFDGSLSPEQAIASIPNDLPEAEKDKRLFYTELYIGMHMVVKKNTKEATRYLKLAVSRKWPVKAGFGPNYMWHVGRVQLDQLQIEAKKQSAPPVEPK